VLLVDHFQYSFSLLFFHTAPLPRHAQGSVDIRLPYCDRSLLTLGKGAHFAESAVVSQEQLMRYDVAASQVTVCVSLTFEDIQKAMKANNCPIALMKTQALQHDELLVRCLRASKKIFELRCASSSPESSESNERLQKIQAKLQYLSSQLFQPLVRVKQDRAPQRGASFASAERSAVMLQTGEERFETKCSPSPPPRQNDVLVLPLLMCVRDITTGKLVSLLDSCKSDEGGRIAVLEAARKQVASALTCLRFGVARINAHASCSSRSHTSSACTKT
jgi:hypothetical protein